MKMGYTSGKEITNLKKIKVDELVVDLKSSYMRLWWNANTSLPQLDMKVGDKEKLYREKVMNRFIDRTADQFKTFPDSEQQRITWREAMSAEAGEIGRVCFGFKESYMNIIRNNSFVQVTHSFITAAREFDDKISIYDIMQAIRNVWIMNSIQLLCEKKVSYSPAIFAYSMLYPYTDNYLDDPQISLEEKKRINSRFKCRLSGELLKCENDYEASLFKLVKMIEGQYLRQQYPEVFDSLLCIHRAQEKSLTQQKGRVSPYDTDILGISFEKGGCSVLADAYLVNGRLTRMEADFMFGFGVILQLADDLQDVRKDITNGHVTIFSQTAGKWPLDSITNRLINFVHAITECKGVFTSPELVEIKGMIKFNCIFLILEAIARNKSMFSKSYIREMEQYSSFRFKYLGKLYKKVEKKYISINRKNKTSIDSLIVSAMDVI